MKGRLPVVEGRVLLRLRDDSLYEGKSEGSKVWVHEGYYSEEGEAFNVARKHKGAYKYVTQGTYKDSWKVLVPRYKAEIAIRKAAESVKGISLSGVKKAFKRSHTEN